MLRRREILIDADALDLFNSRRWYLKKHGATVYLQSQKPSLAYFHRLLLGAHPGQSVDHINRNGLDNRRTNLRVCTHSENMKNRRHRKGASAPYKGIVKENRKNPWRARICVNGKNTGLGSFATAEEAARAYDAAAIKYYGEFAALNFPTPSLPACGGAG